MEQSTMLLNPAMPITNVAILDHTADETATGASPTRIDVLLHRMRHGDRQAAAEFLHDYGKKIRRRIRGKLGISMRRLFDSLDILSTVGRRLDLYVMSGRLTAVSEEQLWSLVFQMADHALIDKARLFRRLQDTEGEDSDFARDMVVRLQKAELEHSAGAELEIERCLGFLSEPADRQILSMWLAGESLSSIGPTLDISSAAARKRWETIKTALRGFLQST